MLNSKLKNHNHKKRETKIIAIVKIKPRIKKEKFSSGNFFTKIYHHYQLDRGGNINSNNDRIWYKILTSKIAKKTAKEGDLLELRAFLKNIGSNFILKDKKFQFKGKIGWRILANSPQFPEWRRRWDSNPRDSCKSEFSKLV